MYYRMIPYLAMVIVGCCLVWALASAFRGPGIGFGGYSPPIFIGPSWNHGGDGSYGGGYGGGIPGPSRGPSSGGSGRSPSGGFGGGGSIGGHGGK